MSELVALLRAGDRQAFDRAYDLYRGRVFGFLVRLSGRRDVAEDILQETWMRLARSARSLSEDTKLDAWLFTVARNLYVSWVRRRAIDLDRIRALRAPAASAPRVLPFDEVAGKELRERLEQAIAELPMSYREVILLVCVEGLEPEEVGRILGLKPEALRQRLSRARAMVKESIREDAGSKGGSSDGRPKAG